MFHPNLMWNGQHWRPPFSDFANPPPASAPACPNRPPATGSAKPSAGPAKPQRPLSWEDLVQMPDEDYVVPSVTSIAESRRLAIAYCVV